LSVYSGPDVYVYSNSMAKGEVWLEDSIPAARSSSSDSSALLNNSVNINLSANDHADSVTMRAESVTAQVTASKPETVVFSEIADSSWKVSVDGAPTSWQVAHGVLIGVPISAGEHKIDLRYLPQAGLVGIYLTGIGWLIIAWIIAAQISPGLLKKSA
jgi:uncharacterized membrane protein YfhO